MKHFTYKISPDTSGWLRGPKKNSVPKQFNNGQPATQASNRGEEEG
jgi:hypothetical protein